MKYKELLEQLQKFSEKELNQIVQIFPYGLDNDIIVPLDSVAGLLKVKEFGQKTRSSYDNKHHPNNWVLVDDGNYFNEDGTMGFDLETGERF